MTKKHVIYRITNTINSKLYIGITSQKPSRRLANHFSSARRGKSMSRLHCAIRKYGQDKFEIEIIGESINKEAAMLLERLYICELNTIGRGYNAHKGGTYYGSEPKPLTKEQRSRQAANLRSVHKKWADGLSEEQKSELVRKRANGVRDWAASRDDKQMSALRERVILQWRSLDEKNRKEISEKMAEKKAKPHIVVSPSGERFVVPNLKDFCKQHGLHQGAMSATANGKANHHKGWKAEHLQETK